MLRRLRPQTVVCGRFRCVSSGTGPDGSKGASSPAAREEERGIRETPRAVPRRIGIAPFAEVGSATSGAAGVMDDLHRPTSQTWSRLFVGVFAGCLGMGLTHKMMDPIDPACVISASVGAFGYVAVVGSSFPVAYYVGAAVPFGLVLPYAWFAHKHEKQNAEETLANLQR